MTKGTPAVTIPSKPCFVLMTSFHLQKVCHQFAWNVGTDSVFVNSEQHSKCFLNLRWGNFIYPAVSALVCGAVNLLIRKQDFFSFLSLFQCLMIYFSSLIVIFYKIKNNYMYTIRSLYIIILILLSYHWEACIYIL